MLFKGNKVILVRIILVLWLESGFYTIIFSIILSNLLEDSCNGSVALYIYDRDITETKTTFTDLFPFDLKMPCTGNKNFENIAPVDKKLKRKSPPLHHPRFIRLSFSDIA